MIAVNTKPMRYLDSMHKRDKTVPTPDGRESRQTPSSRFLGVGCQSLPVIRLRQDRDSTNNHLPPEVRISSYLPVLLGLPTQYLPQFRLYIIDDLYTSLVPRRLMDSVLYYRQVVGVSFLWIVS